MHQVAGTMHGWHIQFTSSCSATPQMGFISFRIQLSPMEQQILMVELLRQWRVVRNSREHKLKLKRNICLTVKLFHIGRQLNGAWDPFKAHLDDYDSLFQLMMISNEQTSWKFPSDSIIYTLGESDETDPICIHPWMEEDNRRGRNMDWFWECVVQQLAALWLSDSVS